MTDAGGAAHAGIVARVDRHAAKLDAIARDVAFLDREPRWGEVVACRELPFWLGRWGLEGYSGRR